MAMADEAPKGSAPPRPTITLPPRSSMESLFTGFGGLSPGPLTLVSNFFSDNYADNGGFRSFSQLLAGAMASPVAGTGTPKLPSFFPDNSSSEVNSEMEGERSSGFKQNRPVNLLIPHSPLFMVPPGLSPSGLLNSPGFFSPLQSPFQMTHQQALAQVTALAALSQSHIHTEDPLSSLAASTEASNFHQPLASNTTTQQQVHSVMSEPEISIESTEASQSEKKVLASSVGVDKPAYDGYNWRKYGQKQVKASEYPRSYYKCTHLNCPVKKKVERNHDGQITEITYKGQHNHELPQSNKRAKDGSGMKSRAMPELPVLDETEMNMPNETSDAVWERGQASTQLTSVQLLGCSNSAEVSTIEGRMDEDGDDEPGPKRRNTEVRTSEPTPSHRTVAEPRIVVQTRSEVDILDDGYKWRKYGQKVVKGNTHPRSYYKCTSSGCNVRKHVERASADPKAVVTTYEGKHNHEIPAGRKSSYNAANSSALHLKAQKAVTNEPVLLQLKEEHIRA